jgi:hypothetical protein
VLLMVMEYLHRMLVLMVYNVLNKAVSEFMYLNTFIIARHELSLSLLNIKDMEFNETTVSR